MGRYFVGAKATTSAGPAGGDLVHLMTSCQQHLLASGQGGKPDISTGLCGTAAAPGSTLSCILVKISTHLLLLA